MFDAFYLGLDFLLCVLNFGLISRMQPRDQCYPIIFNACFASVYLFLYDLQIYFEWLGPTVSGYLFSPRIFWYKVMIVLGLVGSIIRNRTSDWEEWGKSEQRIKDKLDEQGK